MATATTTSGPYSLDKKDFLKGLIVAVITPVITIITTSLDAGELVFNWKAIGITALTAGLAYLVKNFLTPPQIVVTDPTPTLVQEAKEGNVKVVTTN